MAIQENIIPIAIEEEMQNSYLTYAMSVIASRALPDVRDGLKPVHRRILYSMEDMGLQHTKPYKKTARVVGDVLGKYHPHGDASIYNALVRMAQEFSLRYPLIDGQGNFGSIDGDPPAAMRYTEARMSRISAEVVKDLEKNTVDFKLNFDDSMEEPTVLPCAFPNLLLNGSSGIAVGMATNIPPHNMREIIDATCAIIDNPDISIDELCTYVKGPDFPTRGIIHGTKGILSAYKTGRGRIILRAKVDVEQLKNGREAIVVYELPYQTNKTDLLVKMGELSREKKLEGVHEIRDESDRDGVRIVLELKKSADVKVLMNRLFAHTSLQNVFGIIMLALVNYEPHILNLKEMLEYFIAHRKEVLIRKSKFELDKAQKRAHILEGFLKALDHLDEIIKHIRASESPDDARKGLMEKFEFSKEQSQAILDMRLQQLTRLEGTKIEEEHNKLTKYIEFLNNLLDKDELKFEEIKKELIEIKEKYGDDRRTLIESEIGSFETEDLIVDEENVVTITHTGYIKRLPTSSYKRQKRGGRGVSGGTTKDEDFLEFLFVASTHDNILVFTNLGKAYYVKVHEIPEGGKNTRGRSIRLLLKLKEEERIKAFVPVRSFDNSNAIVLITENGVIKRCQLSKFVNAKSRGVRAVKLDEGDNLVSALITFGKDELFVCTKNGRALRFSEEKVRLMGRVTRGVRGIKLTNDDKVIGLSKVNPENRLFVITQRGYGKLMEYDEIRLHGRGTMGQRYIKVDKKSGLVTAVLDVTSEHEAVIITSKGMIIKTPVSGISTYKKSARGLKIVNVHKGDYVIDVAKAIKDPNEDVPEDGTTTNDTVVAQVPIESVDGNLPFTGKVDESKQESLIEESSEDTTDKE